MSSKRNKSIRRSSPNDEINDNNDVSHNEVNEEITNNQLANNQNEQFDYSSLLPLEATRWAISYCYMKLLNSPNEYEWYEKNGSIYKCMEHLNMKKSQYNLIHRVFNKC